MSEGPIRAWRDSWKPPAVSTTEKDRVCARSDSGRAYCGRKKSPLTDTWTETTCADCQAAGRADGWIE